MRKEIEVKAKVTDTAALEQAIAAFGITLSEPLVQDDTVFINYTEPFNQPPAGASFLRIRQSNGKIEFNIKQSTDYQELVSKEHEVEVNDAGEMRELILMLGYHEAIRVRKARRKAKYNDYEICLDEVEGLGTFIEVEKITDEADHEAVLTELFDFLKGLGVKPEDRVMNGYDTLLYLAQR